MSSRRAWCALVVAVCVFGACAPSTRKSQITASIQHILAAPPPHSVDETLWAEARRFYKERDHNPAWVQDDNLSKAAVALAVLRSAADHGLVTSDYAESRVANAIASEGELEESIEGAPDLAQFDVQLTTALLALGRDVALGRNNPESLDPRWKRQRTAPDFAGLLARAAAGDLNTWLPSVQPKHPEYAALQKALALMRSQPAARSDDRLRLLAMNLERWRWMPDDFGFRHILVNVPAFHLGARENGRGVLDMKVVVGEADAEHKTPVFSGEMGTVVFSPYWNVPESIVEGETAPAFARDPSFLERNDMEIVRQTKRGAEAVDPSSVDWDDANELKQLLSASALVPGTRSVT